ncbi:MAG TPA: hypothetical protein VM784_11210 [Actinomycetota bacterium]|nr:hypothetical protein [Actinomycetota bacterium]
MTAQLRAELLRFFSRRMFRWLTALFVAAGTLGATLTFFNSDAVSEPVHLAELPWIVMGSSMWLIFGAWVIGASFVGAEWQKGTMTTTLTWEARRGRVLAAKFAAAGLAIFVWHLALMALMLVLLSPTMVLHGTGTLDVTTVANSALRGATLGAFAAVAAGAVTMIGRTTAAAIGAGFAWFAVLEGFGRALRPQWSRWFVGENAGSFLTWETFSSGRTPSEAAAVLVLYAAVIIAAAWLFFTRRDAA